MNPQIPGQPQPPVQPQPYQQPRPRKSPAKLIMLVLGVMLVIGLLAAIFLGSLIVNNAGEAKGVSDQLVAAVQAKDGDRAYALTGPEFRKSATLDQVNALVDTVGPMTAGGTVDVVDTNLSATTENGTKAIYVYSIKKGADTYYLRVILDKQGDNWQVFNFRVSEDRLKAELE